MKCGKVLLAVVVLLCGSAVASAQGSGAGKLEAGFFPGGGTFFVGGDDDLEVNFNTYNAGGSLSWYLQRLLAVEGEIGFGIGLAQDVTYRNRIVRHVQVPGTVNFNGNVVVFPMGSDRLIASYVTGGAGVLTLQNRVSTRQFGLTESESFLATNVGGGLKILRAGTGLKQWGARIDYRLYSVNSKDDTVAFFAKSKTRLGHRIYVGFLYTVMR
jgi:hypothetical protein